jgi:hypothetical protein
MNGDLIQTILIYISAVISAASVIVKLVAKITAITPGTTDDHIVGEIQKWIAKIQKILGMLALDASNTKNKK